MFLASDRPGALGALDLWVSTRATTSAPWSTPVNLGSVVNTTVIDAFPSLSFRATELYFQSPRPGGLGMFDLYVSTRTQLFRTVLVDPNGSGDRIAKTIQEGITMVAPGGRVRVVPGTYHEQVTVSKNDVTIVAVRPDDDDDDDRRGQERGGGAVVVNAHGHNFGFLVRNASGVTIEGFRVEQAHEADIALNGATFTTIRKNFTTAAGHDGIAVFASNDNVIEHNVAVDNLAPNACGVQVFGGSKRNVVRHNRLVNNEWGIQILGAATLDNVISENRALRNRGNGIRNIGGASGTIIEENRAVGNGFAPSALTGTTAAGIRIGSGVGIVVRENHASGNLLVELLQEAAATATFEDNQCGTSSPAGLCQRDEIEGPVIFTVDFRNLPGQPNPTDPGQVEVVDGKLRIRGQVNQGPLAGDIEGTGTTVLDAEIDQATGRGSARGSFVLAVTKVRGRAVIGTWRGRLEGEINGPVLSDDFSGRGTGDLEDTRIKGTFTDGPSGNNVFTVTARIVEDGDRGRRERDADDDDNDDDRHPAEKDR